MNILERDVSRHLVSPKVRILLVQLNSPFGPEKELDLFPAFGQFQWLDRAHAIERRMRKVSSLISFLRSSPSFRPDVLVFPEYAVPRECHPVLQAYAADQRCIVVAGSYYETERGEPLHRSNISTTFLPDDTLHIVKRHCYLRECEAIHVPPDAPNVLRLRWSYGADKIASISIFICRDYLVPYDVDPTGQHVSLLDWEHSGLNVIVMCSGETRLFQASAALDVRRLRGGGKFVALCNCAGAGIEGTDGGSAFLGPTVPERRERDDIIARLPSMAEGMIFAEVDLDNVAVVETKPDKHVHDPLIRSIASSLSWQDDYGRVSPKPLPSGTAQGFGFKERGVWRAPFLSVIKRNLILKLLIARDGVAARELLKGHRVRWITAASVRGTHDFLITFYAPSGREDANTRVPYCTIDEQDFKDLFEADPETFVVTPEQMYKFRGVVVAETGSDEWARQEEAARELLDSAVVRRQLLVERICKLARDWNTPEVTKAERQEVSKIFAPELEMMPVIEFADDPVANQAFVLIAIERSRDLEWGLFERDIIKGWMCHLPEVRSVYKLSVFGKRPGWDYWLDVAATPLRIDKIVDEIHDRARALKIRVGSRTIGVRYYLKWDSVEGVGRSEQLAAVLNFMLDGSARLVWASGRSVLDVDRLWANQAIANAIAGGYFHQKDVIGWPEGGVGRDRFVRVFAHLFWGNFAEDVEIRDAERLAAKNDFRAIYESAEEIAEKIVEAQLEGDYKQAIETWARAKQRPTERVRAMLDNSPLGLIEVLPSWNLEDFPHNDAIVEFRADFNHKILAVRGRLSHANGHNEQLNFVDGQKGPQSANTVIQAVHALSKALDVLVKLRAWLNLRLETP